MIAVKVRKSLTLSADVSKALDELSEEFDIGLSDLIEFMYRRLGGKRGIQFLLKEVVESGFMAESAGKKEKKDNNAIIWELMDKQAKPVEEVF